MMIYWKLESPSGVAELYERKKDYNLVQNQENIFQENKEFLLSLKESEWRQKTLEERTIAAQKMVRLETERLGIPGIPLYVKQVEVYITECSVHISSGTMLFAYALCLILWLASPIRSYCADGTANEVLFYTFPPSILMLFLFAQYSLKIVLFLAVLDGIFLVTVLRDLHRKKRKYSPKKFWRLKRSDLNAFLFVSVCVLSLIHI